MDRRQGSRLTLQISRSISEIEELREIWTAWQSHPTSDIDHFLSIVRLRPEIERPHVMVIYRDGRPDSILVGRLERKRICLGLTYLKLLQPEARVLCFTYEGFLGNQSAENSAYATREIVRCLSSGEADVARLEFVKTDSPLFEAAKSSPGILCRDHFPSIQLHGSLRLPGRFEDFLTGLSRKERHNLRRYETRLKADFAGEMRIECFRQKSQIEDLIRDTEAVARRTYQRGLGVGFHDSLETRSWLSAAAESGTLRGCILYLGNLPCAFMIGNRYQQTLHGAFMGYDPQFTDYSLGSLLLMHWIREACDQDREQEVSEIDLGLGDARYKRTIYNHTWQEGLVCIFAPTFKGLRLNFQRTVTQLIDEFAKKLLQTAGILEKVKKVWRSRALADLTACPSRQPAREGSRRSLPINAREYPVGQIPVR